MHCLHDCNQFNFPKKLLSLITIRLWVNVDTLFWTLVMSDGILQGDAVSCERCGGNGNYISAFGLQDCCAFLLFFYGNY